jgi:hypothetical protein
MIKTTDPTSRPRTTKWQQRSQQLMLAADRASREDGDDFNGEGLKRISPREQVAVQPESQTIASTGSRVLPTPVSACPSIERSTPEMK